MQSTHYLDVVHLEVLRHSLGNTGQRNHDPSLQECHATLDVLFFEISRKKRKEKQFIL